VLLHTGAAYVSIERMTNLSRGSVLERVNVESRARRGKSRRRVPVALWVTVVMCLVKRSLESSSRSR
jgi:hypothetical protein